MAQDKAGDLLIERGDDRVHYLCTSSAYTKDKVVRHVDMKHGGCGETVEVGVYRFTEHSESGALWLKLAAGPFNFGMRMSVADARLLALALNVAADEAEAPL